MSAYEIPGFSWTLVAAVDLTANQYCGVNVNGSGLGAKPSAGGRIVGFIRNKPNIDENVTVVSNGIVFARVGAVDVAAGVDCKVDANGKLVLAASTNVAHGQTLAAGIAGGLVPFLLDLNHAAI